MCSKRMILWCAAAICFAGILCHAASVATAKKIAKTGEVEALPPAAKEGGMPLMQAFAQRKTNREFSGRNFNKQTLSELLYAACGINRPDGKRTIPTARNLQDLTAYAILEEGAYRYDPAKNELICVTDKDLREIAVMRKEMSLAAPLTIVLVSDTSKYTKPDDKIFYPAVHAGAAMQNLYLYCASEGLNTVVCGAVDREPLAKALALPADHKIQLCQVIGHSPESKL